MSRKIFITVGPEMESTMDLLAMLAGIFGAEVRVEETPAPKLNVPFDEDTYVKVAVPKVLAGYEKSNSKPGIRYRILQDRQGNLYCNCKGFMYRGTCRHIDSFKRKKEMPMVFPVEGTPIQTFHSMNHPGVVYTVKVKNGDYVCTCRGFNFHGTCKHVQYVKRNAGRPVRL